MPTLFWLIGRLTMTERHVWPAGHWEVALLHSTVMELQEAAGSRHCLNILWGAGPGCLHTLEQVEEACPNPQVGPHMGAMLIPLANGIETCPNQSSNEADSRGSVRRALQFPGQGLATGVPCGSPRIVSNRNIKTKNRNSLNFYGNSKVYALLMIILTLVLIMDVCRKHYIFPNNSTIGNPKTL